MTTNLYRQLPSVNQLLLKLPHNDYHHDRVVTVCRDVLETARRRIGVYGELPAEESLVNEVLTQLALAHELSLRPVINATGVIIHTNLGRAPLSTAAIKVIEDVACGYSTLEYDLPRGQRGHRDSHIEALLTDVTGAEAAMVVNNNAAAVYLVLNTLASGHEVILSRSELVEIGGGFRVPDVITQSGAILREVGTTNRTRLSDYEGAITEQTAALMRIHWSNFKVIGFTQYVTLPVMIDLAHRHDILVLDDIGSGALLNTERYGLDHEPTVQESVTGGADIVMFSGDKLLGGPQAGIIVGKQSLIKHLRRSPLSRAFRPDKLCLAGLAATLRHYRDDEPTQTVPVWQMISMPLRHIQQRANQWQEILGGSVVEAESTVGGGSLPGNSLKTYALALSVNAADDVARRLRQQPVPVIVRIQSGQILLDPRTVLPEQDNQLIQSIKQVIQ